MERRKRKAGEDSWAASSSKEAKMMAPVMMPMGFRFSPTDAELVELLGMMTINRSEEVLPEGFVQTANVYSHHPRTLAGMYPAAHDVRGEWYFLTGREARYPKGRRPDRRAGSAGFWKATSGVQNIIKDDYSDRVVGRKMTLVFYETSSLQSPGNTKKSAAEKTKWIMHEYEHVSIKNNAEFQSWVLCRIHQHGGKGKEPTTASAPFLEDSPVLLDQDSDDRLAVVSHVEEKKEEDSEHLAVVVPRVDEEEEEEEEEEENMKIWDAFIMSSTYESTVPPTSPDLPSSHWSLSSMSHDQQLSPPPSQDYYSSEPHSDDVYYSALADLDWDLKEGLAADMLNDLLDHDD